MIIFQIVMAAVSGVIIALLMADALCRFTAIKIPDTKGRLGYIDGLRGFLALGVFIFHYIAIYHWKVDGVWKAPDEAFIAPLGQSAVAVFFMITGYLFIYRILRRGKNIDWISLYISRVFRIYPLYLFAMAVIFATVAYQTSFTLQTGIHNILLSIVSWGAFLGGDVNNYPQTKLIIAGVHWTLRYEALFYISLPLLAYIINSTSKIPLYLLVLAIIIFCIWPVKIAIFDTVFFAFFLIGGISASIAVKNPNWLGKLDHPLISLAALLCIAIVIGFFKTAYGPLQAILLAGFFIPVSLGNSLFGLLKMKGAILLGEVSYSIYLLHGAVLYYVFTIFFPDFIKNHSFLEFLFIMPVMAVIVSLFSLLTFNIIESPMIAFGKKIALKAGQRKRTMQEATGRT